MTVKYYLRRYVPVTGPQDYLLLAKELELFCNLLGQNRIQKIILTRDGIVLTQNEALQIGLHGLKYHRIVQEQE